MPHHFQRVDSITKIRRDGGVLEVETVDIYLCPHCDRMVDGPDLEVAKETGCFLRPAIYAHQFLGDKK